MSDRKQTKQYLGKWWLPDQTDNKIAGILRYGKGEGYSLDLMGSFLSIGRVCHLLNWHSASQ
jgi:hypothetical protein